jgi:hypothetical protein
MKLKSGHAPGVVREAFGDAVDAFTQWGEGEPEPFVEFEYHLRTTKIPITNACKLVWRCTDIVSWSLKRDLEDHGLIIGRRTYAACARAMHTAILQQRDRHHV